MLHVERSYSSGVLSVPGARCLWRGRLGQSHSLARAITGLDLPHDRVFFLGFSNLTLPLETGLVRLFSRAEVREVTEQHCSPLNPSSGIPTVDRENTVSVAEQVCRRDCSTLTLIHIIHGGVVWHWLIRLWENGKNWRPVKALVYVCWLVLALLLWPSDIWCSRGPRPGCPEWPSHPSDLFHRWRGSGQTAPRRRRA